MVGFLFWISTTELCGTKPHPSGAFCGILLYVIYSKRTTFLFLNATLDFPTKDSQTCKNKIVLRQIRSINGC